MTDSQNQTAERVLQEFVLEERAREAEEALQKLLAEIERQKLPRVTDAPSQAADMTHRVWAVKEAFRYCIDATDRELSDRKETRDDALFRARTMDAALPDPWRDDGSGEWIGTITND